MDEDHHASGASKKARAKRSMDMECHDASDDEEGSSTPLPNGEEDDDDYDEDDDSFGEASDDQEPVQLYLDQILEDYHPERLNLLDNNVPPPLPAATAPTPAPAPAPAPPVQPNRPPAQPNRPPAEAAPKISTDKKKEAPTQTGTQKKKSITSAENKSNPVVTKVALQAAKKVSATNEERTVKAKEKDHAQEDFDAEESQDSFDVSESRSRPPNKKLLAGMGKSTKKSFRTMSSTFWAKPFKNLGRGKHKKGKELE